MSDKQGKLTLIPAPQVERILAFFREHHAAGGVGTIPWQRLSDLSGLPHPSTKLYAAVKRAGRRFWKETDKVVITDRGEGVHISTGDEQLDAARGKSMHAVREIRYAHDVGRTIADDRLDEIGRKKRDHFNMRLQSMKTFVQAESKALTAECKAYEALPRPQDVREQKTG